MFGDSPTTNAFIVIMEQETAVQFETTSRIHFGLAVKNLEESLAFYRDFVKQAANDSLREELEPGIESKIDPAGDIARVYRTFRTGHWRAASIYLDRLERKYPHWGEIFMAEAIAFYALQEPLRMKKALETACSLENPRACEDLQTLKRVNDLDLNP